MFLRMFLFFGNLSLDVLVKSVLIRKKVYQCFSFLFLASFYIMNQRDRSHSLESETYSEENIRGKLEKCADLEVE